MVRGGRWLVWTLGLFFLASPPAWAQTTFGTIVGAVTDATGAVIPQAHGQAAATRRTHQRVGQLPERARRQSALQAVGPEMGHGRQRLSSRGRVPERRQPNATCVIRR